MLSNHRLNMKKIIAYTAVLAALTAVSCSRMEENNLAADGHNRNHEAVYVEGHPVVFRGKVCDTMPFCKRIN